jgi:hypothetical protein
VAGRHEQAGAIEKNAPAQAHRQVVEDQHGGVIARPGVGNKGDGAGSAIGLSSFVVFCRHSSSFFLFGMSSAGRRVAGRSGSGRRRHASAGWGRSPVEVKK